MESGLTAWEAVRALANDTTLDSKVRRQFQGLVPVTAKQTRKLVTELLQRVMQQLHAVGCQRKRFRRLNNDENLETIARDFPGIRLPQGWGLMIIDQWAIMKLNKLCELFNRRADTSQDALLTAQESVKTELSALRVAATKHYAESINYTAVDTAVLRALYCDLNPNSVGGLLDAFRNEMQRAPSDREIMFISKDNLCVSYQYGLCQAQGKLKCKNGLIHACILCMMETHGLCDCKKKSRRPNLPRRPVKPKSARDRNTGTDRSNQ